MGRTKGAGLGVTVANQDIYEESATQKHALGERLIIGDRTFRYSKDSGSGITIASMTSGPAHIANHKEVVQTGYPVDVGSKQVSILLTTTIPTAHQCDNGTLMVNKVSGMGQCYKIKSHSLAIAPCVVDLYDDVVTAWAETAEITLTANPWSAVAAFPVTSVNIATGVALIGVTANYYFWAQTKGPAPVIVDTDDTVVIGQRVGKPTTHAVAGACGIVGVNTTVSVLDSVWGYCMQVGAAAEPALVYLTLE